jgi:hypothetical protein
MLDQLLTPEEVATLLRIKVRGIRTERRNGLAHCKIAGRILFRSVDVQSHIEKCRITPHRNEQEKKMSNKPRTRTRRIGGSPKASMSADDMRAFALRIARKPKVDTKSSASDGERTDLQVPKSDQEGAA